MDPPEQKAGTPIDQQEQALRTPPRPLAGIRYIHPVSCSRNVDFLGGRQRAKSATLNGPMLRNLDLLGSFDAREDIVNGLPSVRTHDVYGSF